jgi:hypothetical protein
VIDFPNIKCSYGFDGFDNSHIIEISTSEFFNSNKKLYEALVKIDLNFIELYPDEVVYFFDKNDENSVNNIIYNIEGKEFSQNITSPSYSKAVNYFNVSEFKVHVNELNENLDFLLIEELLTKILINSSEINIGEITFAKAA